MDVDRCRNRSESPVVTALGAQEERRRLLPFRNEQEV